MGARNQAALVPRESADRDLENPLKERCLHYAEVLEVRSETASPGRLITKQLIKLVNGRDTNRLLDAEIAELLAEVADTLSGFSSASSNGEALPGSWLFEPMPDFCRSLFWPVPALSRFQTSAEKTSKPPAISGNITNLLSISRIIVIWGLKAYRDLDDALLDLWLDLAGHALTTSEHDPQEELRNLVSKLFAREDYWQGAASAEWERRCLRGTADLLLPQTTVIPAILGDGRLDFHSLGLKELDVVGALPVELQKKIAPKAGILFGIRGRCPATWVWSDSEQTQRHLWKTWVDALKSRDPYIEKSFLAQRANLCAGKPLEPLKK